jgi:U3 small nucleolar ribonucleoprotein protein LCP5
MDLPSEFHALLETISTGLSSASSALPPSVPATPNGLSLLDLKSSLLLSYLQNLSLLTLSKLTSPTLSLQSPPADKILWQLVQDRVYLERGVVPLETKLGYQIRKLRRAAQDSGTKTQTDENLRFKPNPTALVSAMTKETAEQNGGVYKPPRISSTALPSRREEGPRRNKVLEEFVSSSALSTAPAAIPSIGSNVSGIAARNTYKTSRNRDIETYEEENFIRLPKGIEKDKKGEKRARNAMEGFGGEDWSGLDKLGRGDWKFGGGEGKVERSRKRAVGGDGMDGVEGVSGQEFEKRKKVLQDRKFRKKPRGGKR